MLKFEVSVHQRALSANDLYQIGKNRRSGKCYLFMHPEAKAFKDGNKPRVRKAFKQSGQEWEGGVIHQVIKVHDNWFNERGEPMRIDVDNQQKVIQDMIAEALGIDDKYVFKTSIEKVQTSNAFPFITVVWTEKRKARVRSK